MGILRSLLGIGEKAMEKLWPDKAEARKSQSQINEAEVAGASANSLRLWRSFLGWALAVCFLWEVVARPVIATYWPEVVLPPSFIEEISGLLLGMLGLGF